MAKLIGRANRDDEVIEAQHNPGVPKVGRGTRVYEEEEVSPLRTLRTAFLGGGTGTTTSTLMGGFGAGTAPITAVPPPPKPPQTGSNQPFVNNPASGASAYYNQQQAAQNALAAHRLREQQGGAVTPTTGLPFNPYGTAGMYSFNPSFQNWQSPSQTQEQQNVYQITAADGTVNPPIPKGTYDPNDKTGAQDWQNWWNWQAAHPLESRTLLTQIAAAEGSPDPFAVHVPTREEIQRAKWEQRFKQGMNEIQDGTAGSGYGGGGFTPSFTPQLTADRTNDPFGFYGNQVIAASWRIGG